MKWLWNSGQLISLYTFGYPPLHIVTASYAYTSYFSNIYWLLYSTSSSMCFLDMYSRQLMNECVTDNLGDSFFIYRSSLSAMSTVAINFWCGGETVLHPLLFAKYICRLGDGQFSFTLSSFGFVF